MAQVRGAGLCGPKCVFFVRSRAPRGCSASTLTLQDQARHDCELRQGGEFGPGKGVGVVRAKMFIFYLEHGSPGKFWTK